MSILAVDTRGCSLKRVNKGQRLYPAFEIRISDPYHAASMTLCSLTWNNVVFTKSYSAVSIRIN